MRFIGVDLRNNITLNAVMTAQGFEPLVFGWPQGLAVGTSVVPRMAN